MALHGHQGVQCLHQGNINNTSFISLVEGHRLSTKMPQCSRARGSSKVQSSILRKISCTLIATQTRIRMR